MATVKVVAVAGILKAVTTGKVVSAEGLGTNITSFEKPLTAPELS
jgi:hypothetical protein